MGTHYHGMVESSVRTRYPPPNQGFQVDTLSFQNSGWRFDPFRARHYNKEIIMPLYETRVRTPNGEETKQIFAKDVQEAKKLFEQLYGGPRKVPYIPKVVPS